MHTNSLFNMILANVTAEPEVGMGATILGWTDRYAVTVVAVSKSKMSIVVQYDHAKRTDTNGMSESQTYEYSPNPEGHKTTYTLRKNGQWVRLGESMNGGSRVTLGVRRHYHDFSF